MLENKREKELKEILKRYLNHQASATEVEAVDHWYDMLEVSDVKTKPINHNKRGKIKPLYIWVSAASICLATAFALLFFVGPATPRLDVRISTGATERKEVELSDGTVVMLNTATELLVSGNFGRADREVVLNGEAYFKVAKNPKKPFVIQSGQLKTRVLGTSFNVSAYPDRERIKVSVLTGLVRVSQVQNRAEVILANQMSANQTISLFKKTGEFEMNSEDALLITSWKDNKLYIDNASIRDIAAQLKGFYHLEVKDLSQANPKDRYTIRFDSESMKSVLEILTQLTKRKFEYHNHQITIK
jgi:transmembrane sensor